jgi:hypothetical protein
MPVKTDVNKIFSGLSTPESRWARFGPYYAMFPVNFAFGVVQRYTEPGDAVLDPFAGRFTSIYAAAALGRRGLGIEINPVGWLYGRVKLSPAHRDKVLERLYEIDCCKTAFRNIVTELPEFFHHCFCESVLLFLLSAKKYLSWRRSSIDAALMSHILIYLHGKIGQGLSNQMRMTKSMWPEYSVKWWKDHDMAIPPEIDAYRFLKRRIEWRYAKGMPELSKTCAVLGDSTRELGALNVPAAKTGPYRLLFTSPPYAGIVNYHTDQWLRMWMLGGENRPLSSGDVNRRRFEDRPAYRTMLQNVFAAAAGLMAERSAIFVRTDARPFTFDTTKEALAQAFPHHRMRIEPAPYSKKTQTSLFGDKAQKPGEMDIILESP